MAIAKGAKSRLAWKEESAIGTVATGNFNYRPLTTESLDTAIETIQGEDIREDRATPNLRGGNISVGGNLTHDFGIANQGLPWLRHLLAAGEAANGSAYSLSAIAASTAYKRGDYVLGTSDGVYLCVYGGTTDAGIVQTSLSGTTVSGRENITSTTSTPLVFEYVGADGTDIYEHTLTAGSTFAAGGLSLEKMILGGTADLYIMFIGCRLNGLDLNMTQRGIVKASWDILGITNTSGASSGAGTPASLAEVPVVGHDIYIHMADSYNGVNNNQIWREGTLRVQNGIDADAFVLGSRYRIDVPEGQRQVNGSLTAYFVDSTQYNQFINETTITMGISMIRDGDFLRFEFPEVKLTGNGAPKISGAGLMTMQFDWTAFKNAGAHDVRVIARNQTQTLPI